MSAVLEKYSDRPALADRVPIPRDNDDVATLDARPRGRYETISYGGLARRVRSVATQLTEARPTGAAPTAPALAPGNLAAFLGPAGTDYVTADLACNLAGITTVPLQTSASTGQQRAILAETSPRALVVTTGLLGRAAELVAATPSVERVVVLDHRGGEDAHVRRLADTKFPREIIPETLDLSRPPFDPPAALETPADDLPAMLLYTSGSTGTPKGAVYPERLVASMWGGDGWSEFFAGQSAVSNFHYMPMSHVAGHSSVRSTLARGGLTHFASSQDLSSFFDDLALAAPTELSLVPRVCELIFQEYLRRLAAERADVPGPADDEAIAASVRKTMRTEVLGGNVRWASCTSAPVSAQLKEFMEDLLEIELHELYGTTEIGGVLSDGTFLSPPVLDYRLEDVPELGYYSTDRPHARGELLVRSTSTIPGYYRRPELNQQIFTHDGYYRTGDIASVDAAGKVRIVDRRNAIIKLSQGEFVALPSLEATYVSRSPALRQAFLYGDSTRPFTVAVAVPSPELVAETAGDPDAMRERLLREFRRVAAAEALHSYEIPRDLVVETEPFSEANGLLSDHRKPVRPALVRRYRPALDALYERLAQESESRLEALRTSARDAPTLDLLVELIATTIGGAPETIPPAARFRDLGGDSLTALQLARLLDQVLGVRIPVTTITSDTHTIERLAGLVESRRDSGGPGVTSGEIHADPGGRLAARELELARFLGEDFVPAGPPPRDTASTADAAEQTVLITGANGFLGRFLCLEWLRRAAEAGGRVVCVVRAVDDDAARERLRRGFTADDALLAEFDRYRDHLDVVAGDLAEPRLGLSPEAWGRLCADVDLVVHAGAAVNHALPYEELFDVNVAGTAEIVRLAATTRRKHVVFVSSIATALLPAGAPPLDETADIREALPEVSPDGRNVEGYATSKWAGEVLLREAHDRLGVPVTVIRASMILAHTTFRGQINVPDTLSRLLYSLALTGVAPSSFYARDTGPAHYDGLPVDVVAASIADLTAADETAYRTYHVVNPLRDGVSLDTMVDWLADAGVPITRIDDHADWFRRFGSALHALGEDERRASVLPLLANFAAPEPAVPGSALAADHFLERLGDRGLTGRIRSIDREFVAKSLADLELALGVDLRSS